VPAFSCVVCERETPSGSVEEASVTSNVRAFSKESFVFWRCRHCRSIHAKDEVDLAHYYARYPFHDLEMDWMLHAMYTNLLARLKRAGLQRSHKILDYGCGSGHFVRFLESEGYTQVCGFDEYSEKYKDRSVLDDRYDCIVSQDVIEHVPSPHALLTEFGRLAKDGAVVAVGTPNASAIDLGRPKDFVHTIHAPYHRHILSKEALVESGGRHGMKLDRFYSTMYTNTPVPFLNEAFYLYFTRFTDGTLDATVERPLGAMLLLVLALPITLFIGIFGALFPRHTDVMAVFKRGSA
jgi:SAM-dependent methyltransferase